MAPPSNHDDLSAHFNAKTRDPRVGEWSTSPEFCACLAHYLIEEVGRFDSEHIPASCAKNLKDYQRENDSVVDYCESVINTLPSKTNPDENGGYCDCITVAAAYRGYVAWVKDNSAKPSWVNPREFARAFRDWADRSPNWSVVPEDDGSLKRYSPCSVEYNNRRDVKLFRLADHWDSRDLCNIVKWLTAGDQERGRGIVRAYSDGEPVTAVTTPAPVPTVSLPFAACNGRISTTPVEPKTTSENGRTLEVVGDGTFVRNDGLIWRPGAPKPLVEPYDGVELTRAELEGLACFGRAYRDQESDERVAGHL